MPGITIERPKMTRVMYQSLKKHIVREREKKKQEQEHDKAMEQQRKEQELRKKKEQEDSLTLGQTKEQITALETRLEHLKHEKHELFSQLKKVLHQEDENRKKAQIKEHKEMISMKLEQQQQQQQQQQYNAAMSAHPIFMQPHMQQRGSKYLNVPIHNPVVSGVKRARSPSPPSHSRPVYPQYATKYPVSTATFSSQMKREEPYSNASTKGTGFPSTQVTYAIQSGSPYPHVTQQHQAPPPSHQPPHSHATAPSHQTPLTHKSIPHPQITAPPPPSQHKGPPPGSQQQHPPPSHQAQPPQHQAPPAQHQAPPTQHQGHPPGQHQVPSHQTQAPPAQHQAPPPKHQAPPSQHQAPPHHGQGAPPTQHQAPPAQHQGSQSQSSKFPPSQSAFQAYSGHFPPQQKGIPERIPPQAYPVRGQQPGFIGATLQQQLEHANQKSGFNKQQPIRGVNPLPQQQASSMLPSGQLPTSQPAAPPPRQGSIVTGFPIRTQASSTSNYQPPSTQSAHSPHASAPRHSYGGQGQYY